MQLAAGGGRSDHPGRENDNYRAIVSDLLSLIEHVQASMALIESAIAEEPSLGNQEIAPDLIELDDVTPRYVRANAALEACNAVLAVALHFLRDTMTSPRETGGSGDVDRQPARLIDRA